ncbi:biopolymer transporter ExbD [Rhodoblastus sp.]|uniref:ExbD/TolR family protein n=1 Tax=Rhodoblastus sp. TaxID=1962975 RepID=UPI0026391027|nr:biopolymer transporter ExbD [Rhodoblastus sp.]
MAFSVSGSGRPGFFRPQSEINVTPLVDVMLVLLIIFMVTAPLLTAGMKVQLPQAQAARPLDPKEPVVVVVGRDGQLAIGDEKVAADDLIQLVKLKLGDNIARVVHLRGDKDVAYGRMVEVLDQLASNGITHIAIVTDAAKSGAGERSKAPK